MTLDLDHTLQQALAAHQAGRLAEAEDLYRQVLRVVPRHPDCLNLLGLIAHLRGQPERALGLIGQAINSAPQTADFHNNRGEVLRALGRNTEAAANYRRAISLAPDYLLALNNLGITLKADGQLAPAIACYRRLLAVRPDYADALNNLATTLQLANIPDHADQAFRRAIAVHRSFAMALSNRGILLCRQDRLDEAVATIRMSLVIEPRLADCYGNLGTTLLARGQPTQAMACFRRALHLNPGQLAAFKNLLGCSMYCDDIDLAELECIHKEYGEVFKIKKEKTKPSRKSRDRYEKIRIGYISAEFLNNPIGNAMLPVILHHDRTICSVHCYGEMPRTDTITETFRAAADGWCDITGMGDADLAKRIRADGIDILVCLAGRFDINRPQIAAHRAAPVQISLHDVATSGLAEMDYIIGDRWLLPPHDLEYFSERQLHLPRFYLGQFPRDVVFDESDRDGPVIFGCFNNPAKITPTTMQLWGRILAACPDSRLILKYMSRYSCESLRERILGALAAAGASPAQVEFPTAGREDSMAFLSRYNGVDVALDTMPFSGSTTSFQALAMGVPVVTWPGDRMVSRWTGAMLRALDLPELIASSADDYVGIATRLAKERAKWRQRRGEIRNLAETRLCDDAIWTGHLERLYLAVWRKHQTTVATAGTRQSRSKRRTGPQ